MKTTNRHRAIALAIGAAAAAVGSLWFAVPAVAHGDMKGMMGDEGMMEQCMSMMGMHGGTQQRSMWPTGSGTIESIDVAAGRVQVVTRLARASR